MIKIPFDEARLLLREGDVLLFRGKSWVSFILKRATSGQYSHVGLASSVGSNGGKIWECVEFLENKGGRSVNLDVYLNQAGEIDVFRPSPKKQILVYEPDFNAVDIKAVHFRGKKVTNTMRKMTGLPYGWKRIAWMAQHHIPGLRLLYNMESTVDDTTKDLVYPVCSTAVAYCFSSTGYDLTHHRADKATSPSDIARSPLLNHIFTLIP